MPNACYLACRSLARSRGFFGSAVACWAIGLAANSATVRVADRLLIRPPAHVARPTETFRLYRRSGMPSQSGLIGSQFSYAELRALKHSGAGADFAGFNLRTVDVEINGAWRASKLAVVTAGYFNLLGVRPDRGVFFNPRDAIGLGTSGVVIRRSSRLFSARTEMPSGAGFESSGRIC